MIKDIVIIYFSATGNTKFAANEIGRRLASMGYNVELVCAENTKRIAEIDFDNKLLGVGFPCYAFDYPHVVLDRALNSMQKPNDRTPAFIFTTYCIGDGISRREMQKQLKRRNFAVVHSGGFKCPSSGFYTVKSGREKFIKRIAINKITVFDSRIKDKIELYAKTIVSKILSANCKEVRICKPRFISLLPKLFAKWNESRIFTDYSIDYDKCSMCRLCMDNCPVNNFKVVKNRIMFADTKDCLRCMRCINHCPKDAISLGKQTAGKLRYTDDVRQNLLGTYYMRTKHGN